MATSLSLVSRPEPESAKQISDGTIMQFASLGKIPVTLNIFLVPRQEPDRGVAGGADYWRGKKY